MQKATWMLFILLLFITLTPQSPACAQTVRQENNDIQSKFKTALDLYHAKHFLAAHQLLIDINSNDLPEDLVGDVEFYTLMSSLKLEAKDAFLLADKFKKEHKTYSQMVKLDFLLADYYFEHKKKL